MSHRDRNLLRFRLPIMARLVASGAAVYAICPRSESGDRFAQHGIQLVPFPIDRLTFNPAKALQSVRALHLLLRDLCLDLVHSFMLRPNLYTNLAALGVRELTVVNTVAGMGTLYVDPSRMTVKLQRLLVNQAMRTATRTRAAAVVFQNPDDRAYYIERGICSRSQTQLIASSGVDLSEFHRGRFAIEDRLALRRLWGVPREAVVVTMIARLIRLKGTLEFLETACALKGDAVFVLIGRFDPGNPEMLPRELIEQKVAAGSVILTGRQENIPEWLYASDIYVLPSYREGVPRTVLEAMSMGLPIVTTDTPGCRETVDHGLNGYIVPPRDERALRDAVKRLIADAALRHQMGEQSRRMAEERFDVRSVVKQHMDLYTRLLAGSEPEGRKSREKQ